MPPGRDRVIAFTTAKLSLEPLILNSTELKLITPCDYIYILYYYGALLLSNVHMQHKILHDVVHSTI